MPPQYEVIGGYEIITVEGGFCFDPLRFVIVPNSGFHHTFTSNQP